MSKGNKGKLDKDAKKAMFEERILNELNMILRREVSDTRLQFVSLTHVELSNDFSMAKVYWDTFDSGKRGDIKKALNSAHGMLRSSLAKVLNVRHTPELNLLYDGQFDGEQAIDAILEKEAKEGKGF
jgi:ribosome-binding factor A